MRYVLTPPADRSEAACFAAICIAAPFLCVAAAVWCVYWLLRQAYTYARLIGWLLVLAAIVYLIYFYHHAY